MIKLLILAGLAAIMTDFLYSRVPAAHFVVLFNFGLVVHFSLLGNTHDGAQVFLWLVGRYWFWGQE